jgi:hypothetical protein
MRSKIRSEEYQKKRFKNFVYMWASVFLMVGVPLLFYGGVEYGYWHKPESRQLDLYMSAAWLVVLWTFIKTWGQFNKYQERDELLLQLEMETLSLDEDELQPQTA